MPITTPGNDDGSGQQSIEELPQARPRRSGQAPPSSRKSRQKRTDVKATMRLVSQRLDKKAVFQRCRTIATKSPTNSRRIATGLKENNHDQRDRRIKKQID